MKNNKISLKKIILSSAAIAITAAISLFLFTGCLETAIPAITLPDNSADGKNLVQNTISVSGNGSIKVLPDEANINIAVTVEHVTTQEAVNENSKISKAVIDAVQKINAADLSVNTISYELMPLYDYSKPDQTPQIYAYRVSSVIQVKTTNLEMLGEIIAKATEAGATTISSIGFGLTENTESTATNKALENASKDASSKAAAIASAMGLKVDRILYINESSTFIPGPFMAPQGLGELKSADAVAAPTILPQEIEITATLGVVYLFINNN